MYLSLISQPARSCRGRARPPLRSIARYQAKRPFRAGIALLAGPMFLAAVLSSSAMAADPSAPIGPQPAAAALPLGLPSGSSAAEPAALPAATTAAKPNGPPPHAASVGQELARSISDLWQQNGIAAWGLLLAGIFVGLVAGRIAAFLLARVGAKLDHRGWKVQARALTDLLGPGKLALLSLGLMIGLAALKMSLMLQAFCGKTLLLLFTIACFWYGYNLVSVIDLLLRRLSRVGRRPLDEQFVEMLVPLIRKTLRIFLVVIGVLFVADSVFDQNIGALLAGLGIAGIAVSLAAQDSLKNVFGSITILLDRPFRIGERIVFAGFDGMIEEIGFRSTKLRTLTGHLVTIPNSKIVNDPVENIGRRPYIRRIINLTITYDTPREKIDQAVRIVRNILEEEGIREAIHATIDGDEFPPRVYFNDFNADSLNILVIYWYAPPAYWDYLEHAQRLNLRIFEEFERAGIEFAFPTRTLYLAGDQRRELVVKMLRDVSSPPV